MKIWQQRSLVCYLLLHRTKWYSQNLLSFHSYPNDASQSVSRLNVIWQNARMLWDKVWANGRVIFLFKNDWKHFHLFVILKIFSIVRPLMNRRMLLLWHSLLWPFKFKSHFRIIFFISHLCVCRERERERECFRLLINFYFILGHKVRIFLCISCGIKFAAFYFSSPSASRHCKIIRSPSKTVATIWTPLFEPRFNRKRLLARSEIFQSVICGCLYASLWL